MMTKEDIYETLRHGERVTLECKRAKSSVPNDMWETYSAFCNTYGGDIYLGVHEDLKEKDPARRFTVTGVEDAAKVKKDLWDTLHNPNKVSACPPTSLATSVILDAWNEKHWMKPELTENRAVPDVTLTLRVINGGKDEPINEPIKIEGLTTRQIEILFAIKETPTINREQVADKLNISLATIKREIIWLADNHYIERVGSNKTGYWKVMINLSEFTGSES